MRSQVRITSALVLAIAFAGEALLARTVADRAAGEAGEGTTRVTTDNAAELAATAIPSTGDEAATSWTRSLLEAHIAKELKDHGAGASLDSLLAARVATGVEDGHGSESRRSQVAPAGSSVDAANAGRNASQAALPGSRDGSASSDRGPDLVPASRGGRELGAAGSVPASLVKLRHRLASASTAGRESVPLLDASARADAEARLHDARVVSRTREDFARSFDRALLTWLAAAVLASIAVLAAMNAKSESPGLALLALTAFGGLALLGITLLALTVGPLSGPLIAEKTATHVLFGVIAAVAFLQAAPLLARHAPFADGRAALAAAVFLLAVLAVFGTGPAGSSARINLTTPLGIFQPLELAKLLLVVSFAQHLGRHRQSFALITARAPDLLGPWWAPLLAPFAAVLAALLVSAWVLGDFGAGLVLAPAFALIIVAASGSVQLALAIAAAALIAVPLAVLLPWPADSKVFVRLVTWLVPEANGLPGGDQLALAQQAVAAGGWTGSSWPASSDAVPAGTNDLPIALLIERSGVLGLALFLVAFAALTYAGFAIGARLRGRREEIRYVPMALAFLIAAQTAVAIAGLAGILPLSGIVTPFLSEGGTGMLVFTVAAIAIARSGAIPGGRPLSDRDPLPRGLLIGVVATASCLAMATLALASCAVGDPRRLTDPIPTQLADGKIAPRWGVLLRAVTNTIEAPPIVDVRGRVIAEGRRSYPFGAALAPVTGIARRGIAPLPGTLEAEVRAVHARFPRRPTGAELIEVCRDRCEDQASWTPAGVLPSESAFKPMLLDRIRDRYAGQELRSRAFTAPDFSALAPAVREGRAAVLAELERLRAADPTVETTLDAAVQSEIYAHLVEAVRANKAASGAVVVRDASSGQVLVRASGETDDPETVDAGAYANPALTGAFGSLRDHTTRYAVPPGSTFKVLTAIALLEKDGAFRPEACVHHGRKDRRGVQGNLRIKDGDVSGWIADFGIDRPHGVLDLEGAIEKSCNVWFAHAGLEVGTEELAGVVARAETASFGPGRGGVELAAAAIGQGRTLMTADQLSVVYAAIANDGSTRDCELLFARDGSLACKDVKLASREHALRLQAALRRVVTSPNGTATRAREPKGATFTVSGKTGTAEQDFVRGEPAGAAKARDHAWFAGFINGANGRRFAFAILLARGGKGGQAAAPLAAKIGAVLESHGYFEMVATR